MTYEQIGAVVQGALAVTKSCITVQCYMERMGQWVRTIRDRQATSPPTRKESQTDTKSLLKVKSYSCTTEEIHGEIFVKYVGEVLNQNDWPLKDLHVIVLLRSADRELVSMVEGLVNISPLLPGQTAAFQGTTSRVNSVATLCEISFRVWPRTIVTHESPSSMVPIHAR
jgi:hypothetical protein